MTRSPCRSNENLEIFLVLAHLTVSARWHRAIFRWQAFVDPTYWIAEVPAPDAGLQAGGVWTTVSWE